MILLGGDQGIYGTGRAARTGVLRHPPRPGVARRETQGAKFRGQPQNRKGVGRNYVVVVLLRA